MKKLVSLFISLLILAVIFYKIELGQLLSIFKASSLGWMALAAAMFVPTVMLSALRFKILAPRHALISVGEALKLVLAGSSLNMILPSKMGDIAKGYFVTQKADMDLSLSLSLVVYEKACDMLSLLMWCVVGLVFFAQQDPVYVVLSVMIACGLGFGLLMIGSIRFSLFAMNLVEKLTPRTMSQKISSFKKSWHHMCVYLRNDRSLMAKLGIMSIIIWLLHLIQIWCFIRMLNGTIPIGPHLGLTPLALFAGLLPLTYAGIGTRDAALIYFLKGYLAAPVAAALGILCTLRYLIPAIAGLPYLSQYMIHAKAHHGKDNA